MNQTFFQSFLDKTYEPQGLPTDYPVPKKEGLLFYIQRNQNINTVVYEVNIGQCNDWNLDEPMKVYWIKYNELQEESELNYIQNTLAYGYRSRVISPELVEFYFVSYDKQFFIHKKSDTDYKVLTQLGGQMAILTNMYVYAEEFGVFPEVKFVELFGICVETQMPSYEKNYSLAERIVIVEIIKKVPDERKNQDFKIWLGFSAFYLIWCTTVIDSRVDHFLFYLLITTFLFWHRKTRNFALGFAFFIGFWIIYDGLRVFPNYMINTVHIDQPYLLEKYLFGISFNNEIITPNEYFRSHNQPFLDVITALFYLTWVPIPMLLAAYLFRKNTKALLEFTSCYLFTNLLGFVIYYSYPAAPPWYFDTYGNVLDLSVPANAAGLLEFDKIIGYPLFEGLYTKNSNVFAAIPSLHAAYPVITWFYARKYAGKTLQWIVLIDIIGIWFSAVYSFHHYVIDVLIGGLVAFTALYIYENILSKTIFSEYISKFARFIDR